MKTRIGHILTKKEHKKIEKTEIIEINQNGKPNIYYIKIGEEKLLIYKKGKCDYKKCKAACCRFILYDSKGYGKGFGKKGLIRSRCKNLQRNNKCLIWGKKLHTACKQYPHPKDNHYMQVFNVCSIRFKIIGIFKEYEEEKDG